MNHFYTSEYHMLLEMRQREKQVAIAAEKQRQLKEHIRNRESDTDETTDTPIRQPVLSTKPQTS